MQIRKIFVKDDKYDYMCGYFDTKVFSSDCSKILVHRFPRGQNQVYISVEVGYINIFDDEQKFNIIGETNAFNYQQGSRLQYLDGDCNELVAYNRYSEDQKKYETCIYNLQDNKIVNILPSVYCISNNNKYAVSLNFELLELMHPGYGYIVKHQPHEMDSKTQLLFKIIDIDTADEVVSLSKNDIKKEYPNLSDQEDIYAEHMAFNEDSSMLSFICRYKKNGLLVSLLFSYNINLKTLSLVNNSGRITHYCWFDNERILAWTAANSDQPKDKDNVSVKKWYDLKFLRRIYRNYVGNRFSGLSDILRNMILNEGYFIIDIYNTNHKKLASRSLKRDGHPVKSPKKANLFITDTYPDYKGELLLQVYDIDKEMSVLKTKFKHDHDEIGTRFRADLHPKVSNDGNMIGVDLLRNNERTVCIIQLLD